MIRVTLLSTDIRPVSGWGTVTHDLCVALSHRDDVDFQVLLPKSLESAGKTDFPERVHYMLPDWVGSYRSVPHKLVPLLLPRMHRNETNVVHSVVEFPYAVAAWRLAYNLSVPFVISVHGTYGVVPFLRWPDKSLYRWAFRRAAAITAPSSFTALSTQRASGIDRCIQVIHNPINFERFQKNSDGREVFNRYGIPSDALLILSVGAIKKRKGFDVLIKAFVKIVSEEPRAWLAIAGNGPSDALRELASRSGIETRVSLLGEVPNDDLTALYKACRVFALLPRNEQGFFEGFGLVYLEAGACGKPVVGTRSGGVLDAVKHGETGFLVEENDHESAALEILRLLRDDMLARRFGEAGRKWAAENDRLNFAEKMMKIYGEVVAGQRTQV